MLDARRLARRGAQTVCVRQHVHQPPVPALPAAHPSPRGVWLPAAVRCAATRLDTAAQELSASETATDPRAAAGNGSSASQHRLDSVPADVLTDDNAAAAERRASGRLASPSGGATLKPVAVARCHTLDAEVCHGCMSIPVLASLRSRRMEALLSPVSALAASLDALCLHCKGMHATHLVRNADVLRRGCGSAQSRSGARMPPVWRLCQWRRAMGSAAATGRQRPPMAAGMAISSDRMVEAPACSAQHVNASLRAMSAAAPPSTTLRRRLRTGLVQTCCIRGCTSRPAARRRPTRRGPPRRRQPARGAVPSAASERPGCGVAR